MTWTGNSPQDLDMQREVQGRRWIKLQAPTIPQRGAISIASCPVVAAPTVLLLDPTSVGQSHH
ncbi:MAG: hypothetical protein IIC60_14205 [Proteobacteria bacterium]|nr:hypothetical protein [Pseudomonadota bacterium]